MTTTRKHPCGTCGAEVEQRYSGCFASYTDGTSGIAYRWFTPRHDAPCGLPCLGGGVPPVLYRQRDEQGRRLVHGGKNPCPRCKANPGEVAGE